MSWTSSSVSEDESDERLEDEELESSASGSWSLGSAAIGAGDGVMHFLIDKQVRLSLRAPGSHRHVLTLMECVLKLLRDAILSANLSGKYSKITARCHHQVVTRVASIPKVLKDAGHIRC